jgi:hypothetical protein
VPKRILTQCGDVLILRTEQSFTIYAVGRVSHDGQEDFRAEINVEYVIDYAAAVAEAKRRVVVGRRILFRNIDTGDWSEISSKH